jgi:glycine cleavage system H lipoate-binding protein
MGKENSSPNNGASPSPTFAAVYGFQVPVAKYYLHRGHAWATIEETGLVRMGVDDFVPKVFGPAEAVELPEPGGVYFQGHVCLALVRQGRRAKVLAPVDGLVEEINLQVQERPQLLNDDPYGAGWLCLMRPINLKYNLPNLHYGAETVAWFEAESQRLLQMVASEAGVTLPDGGTIINDVYGHFPELNWRRLVQEFLLQDLTRVWKKRA